MERTLATSQQYLAEPQFEPSHPVGVPDRSSDDLTATLLLIWQQVLAVDSVAVDQNFFDLGGESSLAVQMFARVEEAFGVKLPGGLLRDPRNLPETGLRIAARQERPAGARACRGPRP